VAYDLFGTGKTVLRGGWGSYRWNQYNDVGLIQPIFTCDPVSSLGSHEQINVSCLTAPAIGNYGQRVVPASGPAYFKQDLAIHKSFAITERQKVEFRLSAFNLFNHPLWAMNWGNMGNLPMRLSGSSWALNNVASDYGQVTTKTEYLRIQLGLKYTF
jgi:hypothetical protein